MKIVKYIVFLLLLAFVGGSLYLASIDGNYEVKRMRFIKAPIEVVFKVVNDYKTWQYWGPWNETDSTIVYTFPLKTTGIGATFSWKATSGDGNMENVASVLNDSINDITYFDGKGTVNGTWKFNKVADGVEVTWKMKGKMPFLARFMAATMETEIGPMLDRGLELLEIHVQNEMKMFSIESKGAIDFEGSYYLYQTTSCRFDEIDAKMNEMNSNLAAFIMSNQIETTGNQFTIFHKRDDMMQTATFSTCIPIKEHLMITDKTVLIGMMPSQRVFKTILKGDYRNLFEAWETAYKNLAVQGFVTKLNAEPFEVYVIKKNEVPNPANWITEIYIPIE